jgi:putative tricarboxylic transport membrane protein
VSIVLATPHRRWLCFITLLFALAFTRAARTIQPPPPRAPRIDRLTIVAPGAPTGGWARTAEQVARTLRSAGLVGDVTVVNREGDSGSFALAEFVEAYRGNGRALLVGGSVMLGVAPSGPVGSNFRSLIPIARLTGESQALATAATSPFRTLDDLLKAVREAPSSILWVGGSYGGSNYTAVTMIAEAMGVDEIRTNFVPTDSRADMLAFVTSNPKAIGLGGFGEFGPDIAAGRLRVLGLTADAREYGADVPTLREKGVDVVFVNWRGLFAAPGTTAEEQEVLASVVADMVNQAEWRAVLRQQFWGDMYQGPRDFAHFLDAVLQTPRTAPPLLRIPPWSGGWRRVPVWLGIALTMVVIAGLVAGGLWWRQRRAAQGRERVLTSSLEEARQEAERHAKTADALIKGVGDKMDKQFEVWALTPAEKEVASLLLKGIRHKEIGEIRQTSERTVRQQSLAIYRKAGVEGRTELAAYFLEDLLPAAEETNQSHRPLP